MTSQHAEEECGDPAVFFEMSVTNANKPPLDPSEAGRRVDLFATLQSSGATMPEDWAVVLTNAPWFSQKADVLYDIIPGGDPTGGGGSNFGSSDRGALRKMSFIIRTNTLTRIIDPKYYGNSQENMPSELHGKNGGPWIAADTWEG